MWHHTSVIYKASNTWHTCGVTSVYDMWANMWHLILSHIWHLTCVSDMCVTLFELTYVSYVAHIGWCVLDICHYMSHDVINIYMSSHLCYMIVWDHIMWYIVLVTHMVVYVWYMMIHMFSYRASAHVCGNLYVTHNLYVVHDWHTSHMCDTTDTCMRPHVWQKWVTNMFKHVQYILFVCHMCALLCMSHVWLLHVCILLA